jgi:hypothetical protein
MDCCFHIWNRSSHIKAILIPLGLSCSGVYSTHESLHCHNFKLIYYFSFSTGIQQQGGLGFFTIVASWIALETTVLVTSLTGACLIMVKTTALHLLFVAGHIWTMN